jgi:hypothetical protein
VAAHVPHLDRAVAATRANAVPVHVELHCIHAPGNENKIR